MDRALFQPLVQIMATIMHHSGRLKMYKSQSEVFWKTRKLKVSETAGGMIWEISHFLNNIFLIILLSLSKMTFLYLVRFLFINFEKYNLIQEVVPMDAIPIWWPKWMKMVQTKIFGRKWEHYYLVEVITDQLLQEIELFISEELESKFFLRTRICDFQGIAPIPFLLFITPIFYTKNFDSLVILYTIFLVILYTIF